MFVNEGCLAVSTKVQKCVSFSDAYPEMSLLRVLLSCLSMTLRYGDPMRLTPVIAV